MAWLFGFSETGFTGFLQNGLDAKDLHDYGCRRFVNCRRSVMIKMQQETD
jgi:hypothetical protein